MPHSSTARADFIRRFLKERIAAENSRTLGTEEKLARCARSARRADLWSEDFFCGSLAQGDAFPKMTYCGKLYAALPCNLKDPGQLLKLPNGSYLQAVSWSQSIVPELLAANEVDSELFSGMPIIELHGITGPDGHPDVPYGEGKFIAK